MVMFANVDRGTTLGVHQLIYMNNFVINGIISDVYNWEGSYPFEL